MQVLFTDENVSFIVWSRQRIYTFPGLKDVFSLFVSTKLLWKTTETAILSKDLSSPRTCCLEINLIFNPEPHKFTKWIFNRILRQRHRHHSGSTPSSLININKVTEFGTISIQISYFLCRSHFSVERRTFIIWMKSFPIIKSWFWLNNLLLFPITILFSFSTEVLAKPTVVSWKMSVYRRCYLLISSKLRWSVSLNRPCENKFL